MAAAVVPTQKGVGGRRFYTYDEVLAEFPETNQPCELCDEESARLRLLDGFSVTVTELFTAAII